jgi:hypothetical protein
MFSKKRSKSRFVAKRKAKGFSGFDKKTTKPLPDTSRIPWFAPMPKTGTDA